MDHQAENRYNRMRKHYSQHHKTYDQFVTLSHGLKLAVIIETSFYKHLCIQFAQISTHWHRWLILNWNEVCYGKSWITREIKRKQTTLILEWNDSLAQTVFITIVLMTHIENWENYAYCTSHLFMVMSQNCFKHQNTRWRRKSIFIETEGRVGQPKWEHGEGGHA